jgi:pantothenate kinase
VRVLTAEAFAAELAALAGSLEGRERRIVAVAGPPGSGKSTLAEALEAAVDAAHSGRAAVLPMDGYHYDDEVLVARGWRPRKGAPHTFDVGGLASMLRRLRANDEAEVAVPRFDRAIEIARAGARLIPQSVRVVIVEGNWLLLDEAPWSSLAPLFDVTAMVRVPEEELARRLAARWEGYGLDAAGVRAKLEDNDLPNGRLVVARSRPAAVVIGSG